MLESVIFWTKKGKFNVKKQEVVSMMKRWMIVVLGLCVIGCLSCDEKSDDENPFTEVGDISLFDAEGNVSTGLDAGASAFWQFDQLLPRTLYNIELKNETGNMVSQASLTTDANGEIPLTAIGYDLGLLFPGGITNGSLAKIGRATVETFTLEMS